MNKSASRLLMLMSLAMAMSTFAVQSAQAGSQCQQIPVVPWWSDTDHRIMTAYVDARHGGDWDSYINKWRGHLASLRAIHNRGGAVRSKRRDQPIKGRDLYDYIQAVEIRLAVTRCLAEQEMAKAAEMMENLETASGGDEPINDALPETVK